LAHWRVSEKIRAPHENSSPPTSATPRDLAPGLGLLGLQLGVGLQLAARGGFNLDLLPVLWLAGPVTALLLQPLTGSMSDGRGAASDAAARTYSTVLPSR
jgi:hypothetical protein